MKKLPAYIFALIATATAFLPSSPARAEVGEVRLAQQFGINYLPLTIMRTENLIEKHAAALGLGKIKVTWLKFGGSNSINDALLSGQLDFGSGGVAPLLTVWDKTKGIFDVRGVAALGSMPFYLNSSNPNVKTLADFTSKDKIALPAVEVSIQAVVLQMAAAKAFGMANYKKLDRLTVGMKHPDAMAALLSGTEVTAHFANSPFQEQELQNPAVHRVLSSYEVLGEPTTLNSVYATKKFHDNNPKTYQAVLNALKEAMQFINADKARAAKIYVESEKSKLSAEFVQKILEDPDFIVTSEPKGIMKYAEFMHAAKKMKNLPKSAKDIYFPELYQGK
ncbi:MAG: ABC transporter substrate-binding protein [Afipia felis]|nr:ABC transporter substrate-binding protein [Afipia felis]